MTLIADVPLLKHAPKCKAQLSLMQLASNLCGKEALQEQPAKKEKRGFFSFR